MTDHESKFFHLSPMDEHNRTLAARVHPEGWHNPQPDGPYNVVVIGAGTAGLISAAAASGLGAKTALVERGLLGGDCLNVGCVPSKSMIRSARAASEVRNAADYGVEVSLKVLGVNFEGVMERMRQIRARISVSDSAQRFKDMGVDVYLGEGKFTGSHSLQVADKTLTFKKAVIATGARAVALPVEGLKESGFLTNETLFNLVKRPERLAVIGGGPIGCEMAQTFRRIGSDVTVFEMSAQILGKEDGEAAAILAERFRNEGIRLVLESKLIRVEKRPEGKTVYYEDDGKEHKITVDEILLGAGRAPNVESLNLEAAGVAYDAKKGIHVDDRLQTTQPHIYAAGDVCLKYKFTHTAEASAKIVVRNALFFGRSKFSDLIIPWCTYTDPEVAHTGMYEKEAGDKGIETQVIKHELKETDRAVAEGETEGFVKMLIEKKSGKILGATIVARHAGEMISEVTTAMHGGLKLGQLPDIIHPYPTQAEAIKRAGDHFNRSRYKAWMKKLLLRWFEWRR